MFKKVEIKMNNGKEYVAGISNYVNDDEVISLLKDILLDYKSIDVVETEKDEFCFNKKDINTILEFVFHINTNMYFVDSDNIRFEIDLDDCNDGYYTASIFIDKKEVYFENLFYDRITAYKSMEEWAFCELPIELKKIKLKRKEEDKERAKQKKIKDKITKKLLNSDRAFIVIDELNKNEHAATVKIAYKNDGRINVYGWYKKREDRNNNAEYFDITVGDGAYAAFRKISICGLSTETITSSGWQIALEKNNYKVLEAV